MLRSRGEKIGVVTLVVAFSIVQSLFAAEKLPRVPKGFTIEKVASSPLVQYPMMGGFDDRNDRYKLHLPPVFSCGLVFFDLSQEHQFSKSALNKIVSGIDLRGFFGGVILRGEGCRKDVTGKLMLLDSATPITSTIGKGKESLFQSPMSDSVEIADGRHCGATLNWAEYNFSQFGFGVIAMMQGTYQVGRLSSFYGMGTSEQEQSQS